MKKSEILKIVRALPAEDISLQYLSDLFAKLHKEDPPIRLTDEQRRMIDKGLEDVKAGRVIDSEELDKMEDEWLDKE